MLPYRILKLELFRRGILNDWYSYLKRKLKLLKTIKRIGFLKTCYENKIIPKFLKLRVPNNGCFNKNAVERFQANLLETELREARILRDKYKKDTEDCLIQLRSKIPRKLIPTVLLHTRTSCSRLMK